MTTLNQSLSTTDEAVVHLYEDFPDNLYHTEDFPGNLYLLDSRTNRCYKIGEYEPDFRALAEHFLAGGTDCIVREVEADDIITGEYTYAASYSLERGVHNIIGGQLGGVHTAYCAWARLVSRP